MLRDSKSSQDVVQSLVPAVRTGTANGTDIDLKGYGAALVVVTVGAVAGAGNQTAKVEESDAGGGAGYTDVAAADLIGAFTSPLVQDTPQRVGYRGSKRFIRVTITHNSGTSVATGAHVARSLPAQNEDGLA